MNAQPEERDWLPNCWSKAARGTAESANFDMNVCPWNWLELGKDDASTLWRLLDEFVEYFNVRYGCRMAKRIPPCWAEHGPVVEEITTLMFVR